MKRRNEFGFCLLLGFSVLVLEAAQCVAAGEPLPDASLLAYRPRPPKPQPPPKVSDVMLTGVITDVQSNGLKINAGRTAKGKDQKQWLVLAPSESTEFTIRGTATLDYLRNGQIVELSGQTVKYEAADKGNDKANEAVAEKVGEFTIVSRKKGSPPHKAGAANEHAANAGGGRAVGAKPDKDSDALLTAPDNDAKPTAGGGLKEKILGRVAAHDAKSLTVTSGHRTIHVDLADVPTINVELSDPKLVKDREKTLIEGKSSRLLKMAAGDLVGAKVVVRGTAVEGKSGSQCLAKSIDVTLAKPLTGKKPAAKKTPTEK